MYKILVCGGRNYNNYDHVSNTLNMIVCKHIISDVIIIQGGAKGADFLAKQYAIVNCIKLKEYPANWNLYGRSAGFIRNEQMLLECPNLVVAFPGGKGTADMVRRAKKVGIEVLEIKDE